MNHGVGNRARPRTAGDGAGHGLLANHRRTPPQIGSVTLALAPEPSGCDTPPPEIIRTPNTRLPATRLPATRHPISPMIWTTQPRSQKRRRWTFHRRLFRRAETASATAKVYKTNRAISCYKERRYGAMQPQQERCLELIPGRMEVVREVVTGPRKWEIRS